ncbi:MAG: DEAD/DEAH box helicase, partial [Myxococcales bacterium]|nr:DEAD/DEAH box helicase [Myxococcales bacterium]
EAGLIMRELKLRGLVERILVVAPAGLVTQWVAEMRTHFTEEFQLVVPGEMSSLRRLHGVDEGDNLWRRWNQVVCPMDSVKPMERRKGWSFRQVQAYNRDRFVDMLAAGWDLVVIDEAHRMGGSSEQVARYKLGEALSEASPYLLLLSATPHQGKTDNFRRLMAFLDKNPTRCGPASCSPATRSFSSGSSPMRWRRAQRGRGTRVAAEARVRCHSRKPSCAWARRSNT